MTYVFSDFSQVLKNDFYLLPIEYFEVRINPLRHNHAVGSNILDLETSLSLKICGPKVIISRISDKRGICKGSRRMCGIFYLKRCPELGPNPSARLGLITVG